MHHQWESGGECVAWRRFADDASAAFVSATKVSAVARSAAGDVLATADELGAVPLFKNPCPEAGAASARYAAHGPHITACAFTADDGFLLTAGGTDRWCVPRRDLRRADFHPPAAHPHQLTHATPHPHPRATCRSILQWKATKVE